MPRPLVLLIVASAIAACGEPPLVPQRTDGTLQISVTMTGFLPSRTVAVSVDDTLAVAVEQPTTDHPEGAHGTIRLPIGLHRVAVTGLDPNCAMPDPMEISIHAYSYNGAEFRVNCAGDASLVGGGLAWVEDVDGWGNYLFYNSGIGGTRTLDSYGTIDLAWSPGGNEIATVDGTGSVVVLDILSGQKTRSIGSGLKDVAITQGPGTDQYSVLELRSSCRIVILGGHAGTEEAISCGAATAVQQGSADIAWSPDGRTAAVASYNATAFRLVERESATVRNVPLPDHRFAPVATAWATNGTGVFVLGLCLAACTPGELSLLIFDRESGSWKEVGQWPTDVRASFEASLEVFGAKHVAVGPVNRSVLLVPIDRPGEARVLLGPDKFRVARRPG